MNNSLEDYRMEMARRNKVRAQAVAILQRAKNAGIPEKHMRIKESEFHALLSKPSYNEEEISSIMNATYKKPEIMLKKSFILIDGGNHVARRRAGFALLFRMIACDKFGRYESCREVAHKLQVRHDFNRQPFAQELKLDNILFLGECEAVLFSDKDDIGTFFDEILEYREDNCLPTIISFVEPLGNLNIMKSKTYGNYLSDLTRDGDLVMNDRILHVRVKE